MPSRAGQDEERDHTIERERCERRPSPEANDRGKSKGCREQPSTKCEVQARLADRPRRRSCVRQGSASRRCLAHAQCPPLPEAECHCGSTSVSETVYAPQCRVK